MCFGSYGAECAVFFCKTIKSQLRVYSLLLIMLPLALSVIVFYAVLRRDTLQSAEQDMEVELSHNAEYIEQWFAMRLTNVSALARMDAVRRDDRAAMVADFNVFLSTHNDFRSLIFVDAEGKTAIDFDTPPGVNLADRQYFQRAKLGLTTITPVLIGRTLGKPIVIFAAPVKNYREEFTGLIFGTVRLDALLRMVSSMRRTATDEPFIVRAADHKPLLAKDDALSIPVPPKRIDGLTIETYSNSSGIEVVGVSRHVKDGEWLLVQERAMDDILGDMSKLLLLIVVFSCGSVALFSPIVLRLSSRISHPVESISKMSESLIGGDYDMTCPMLDTTTMAPELARLYSNFCSMAQRIASHVDDLQRLSLTDPLTKMGNRRSLLEEGMRIVASCNRNATPCSCIVLDIDHFKRVNDVYGHMTGDIALQQLADILRETLRKSDFVVRMGGEEFAVICGNSDVGQALALAERVREAVASHPVRAGGVAFVITVSLGVATVQETLTFGASPLEDVLARADCALYQAKAKGRNRVEQWSELSELERTDARCKIG